MSTPTCAACSEAEGTPYIAITKGALDQLLEISDRVWVNDAFEPLDEGWRERIRDTNAKLAQDGLRVLGVAFRPLTEAPQPARQKASSGNLRWSAWSA